MKHKGCKMEYYEERLNDIMRAYRDYIASHEHISLLDLYNTIGNLPSRRFWVSGSRAAFICRALAQGQNPLASMHPLRQEMFREIYNRVRKLQATNPDTPLINICEEVVAQPAPKFYIAPDTIKILICKERKKWIKQKMRKLYRLP